MGSPPIPEGYRLVDPGAGVSQGLPPIPEGYKLAPLPIPSLPTEAPMSWGDMGRAAMTAGVRGLGGLVDAIPDPLSPLRRLISPEAERIEQQGAVHPGQMAGNAIFSATGVPEYQPTTPVGRTLMAGAQGAVSGAPFGAVGALPSLGRAALGAIGAGSLGAAGGLAGNVAEEATSGLGPNWSERLGTLAGLAPGGAAAAMGRRAVSRSTPELDAAGVNPTFGQAMGGLPNRIEQGLASVYGIGDIVKGGRAGATEEFNRGYINRALGRVGEELPADMPLGRRAIEAADDLIGDRYNQLTPQITNFRFDPQFATGLGDINRRLAMYPQAVRDDFARVVQTEILNRMNQPGGLTGQAFRDAESELGRFARESRGSQVRNEQVVGRAVQDLQSELRDQLRRSNPQIADELGNIHAAYREMLPMDIASGNVGTGLRGQSEAGVVTPSQLTAAVRANDPTLRKRAFRQGNAVGQDYAEPAIKLLGDTLPDSGTATRLLATLPFAAGGAAATQFLNPVTLGLLGGGLGGAGLMYSAPGRAAMNYFLRRPEQSATIGLLGDQSGQQRRGLLGQ